MKIAFFAENSVPFHAKSLHERPLGGTETGVIRLSEKLQELGYEVYVFTKYEVPPSSFPIYKNISEVYKFEPYDFFISIQGWKSFFYNIKSKFNLLWTGDGYDILSNFGLGDKRVIEKIDGLLTASAWHRKSLIFHSGFPENKAFVLGNGVHENYYNDSSGIIRDKHTLIYSTAPNRGLVYLPYIFTEAKKAIPELKLKVISGYSHYDEKSDYIKELEAQYIPLKKVLLKIDGVQVYPNLTQEELAKHLLGASIYCYPCTVKETCSISVMEAQFAGNAVISSTFGALPETIGKTGILVKGIPSENEFINEFIKELIELQTDMEKLDKISVESQLKARKYFTWSKVSDRFIRIINYLLVS